MNLSGLKDFAFVAYCTYNYNERVETPTAPNSNSSSAEAIFDQKIPSHSFQTEQHVRGRFEESSRIVQSKSDVNGPTQGSLGCVGPLTSLPMLVSIDFAFAHLSTGRNLERPLFNCIQSERG